ncbi:MAG TPA: isoprenylcysteine carboxylmethyltransferase family protein [Euzebyales bacterium]|nr:isoprenylcysteine carboxylmethyltransferase family protein [Euzebyales bacterium]
MTRPDGAEPGSVTPAAQPRAWRWGNVPVPEAHLGVAAAGLAIGVLRPRRIGGQPARCVGWGLVASGVALAVAATRAAGATDLARPDHLVTSGPYARSRHPMYVAWTAIYLGFALVVRSAWLLRLTPLLAGLIHREARGEEERLAERFGAEYDAYRARVRRYV